MKKIIHRIFLIINAGFALALLISYLAININPNTFALPAFFGLAYPYLLLVNVIIAIIWAVNLKYEALISVVFILLGLTHFSNYIKFRRPGDDRENTFKVISYNVHVFSYLGENKRPDTKGRILSVLKEQQPGILCLQEFSTDGDFNIIDHEIKDALGGRCYSYAKLFKSRRSRQFGIVTYSKFPIINKGEIVFENSSSLSIYADIIIDRDTFRIFNSHLQSFGLKSMEGSFMEELMDPRDKQTIDELKSLYARLREGFKRRALQARIVKDHINNSPYTVIVAGDFNDTPVSYSYRRIRKGLKDSFVESGSGAGFTYRGNYPPNRIDYILYGNRLECPSFEILRVKFSDHYPIIAWLRKRPKKEAS